MRRARPFFAIAILWVGALGTPGLADDSTIEAFQDGGERSSLGQVLRSVRPALGAAEDGRRSQIDAIIAALDAGTSPGSALSSHARIRDSAQVLLTGYYEPVIAARRKPSKSFRYPLYALPPSPQLRKRTRREIDSGVLGGQGLELFWLDDPIESFFLHVQGSGRLRLGDGSTVRVGYAGNNGRAYHSIGAELVSRGVFTPEQATAPAIKKWLREHTGEIDSVLHTNPRFIYFRELSLPAAHGPPGAMGRPLVPFRSVAVDPQHTPMGTIGLLTAKMPDASILRRIVVAMDTGAAIRGPSRVDLFVGAGPRAARVAGELRADAKVVWLR